MSLYDDLGVDQDADDTAIKTAHRAGVKRHHPDTGGDTEAFDKVQRAYAVLSDPDRRARYDATGSDEDPAKAEDQEAKNRAVKAFAQAVMCKGDVRYCDLVAMARDALEGDIVKMQMNCQEATRGIERGKAMRERVEGPEGSVLAGLLDQLVRDTTATLAQMEIDIRLNERAIELMADTTYRIDERPMPPIRPGGYTMSADWDDSQIARHMKKLGY